jgi:hypothetical protein
MLLAPNDTSLDARDGDYMKLYWGDVAEFVFKLPDGVAEGEVVKSRLTLTGYYERYGAIMATMSQVNEKPRNASMLQSAGKVAAFCKVRRQSRRPLRPVDGTGRPDGLSLELGQDR